MDPLTIALGIASLATAVGGTVAQSNAAKKANLQRAALLRAETDRQQKIGDEAKRKVADSLGLYEPEAIKKKEDQIVGENLQKVSSLISKQSPKSFQSGSAPKLIKEHTAAQVGQGQDEAMAFSEALARFGAQGQALEGANLGALGNAQRINMLNADRQASAGLLRNELDQAAASGYSPGGAMLSNVGQSLLASSLAGSFEGTRPRLDEFGFTIGDPLSPTNLSKNAPQPLS